MIRPLSLLTGIAMAAAIGHTFEVKRSVTMLDRELRDIRRGTEEVEGRTQLLQAEWARLNDQERLRGLADRHLAGLSPMQSGQFQRLDEAVRRLPVAVAWNAPASPFAPRDETTLALAQAWLAPAAPAAPAPVVSAIATARPATAQTAGNATAVASLASAAQPSASRPGAMPALAGNANGAASLASVAQPSTSRPGATPALAGNTAGAASLASAAQHGAARPSAMPAPASNAAGAASLASAAQPSAARQIAMPAPPSSPARAAEPAAQRPSQFADASGPRTVRSSAIIPEAPSRAAQSLPPVAARPAEAPAKTAAPPAIFADARRNTHSTRNEETAALTPVASPIRPAVHVQRADTGSMLGGQSNGIAPPVPYIR